LASSGELQILNRSAVRRSGTKKLKGASAHAKADTMASESMQDLPESLKQRDGSMYAIQPVRARLRAFAAKRDQIAGGYSRKLLILWWALQDSNLRLPPCEGGFYLAFC
jgi:hypothetical protein